MGRWAEKKAKYTVTDEIHHQLEGMLKAGMGRSRQDDKKAGIDGNYIYASKTYKTYQDEAKRFARWAQQAHPEVRHLKQLRKYANEYIQEQISAGYSAWTITTRKAAIAKALSIPYKDMIATPARERAHIVRSRGSSARDAHISADTEAHFAIITAATGLRRREMLHITGDALKFDKKTGKPFLSVTDGTKGGKARYAWICAETPEQEQEIISLFRYAGKLKVCPNLHSAYDNHHYRADYAKRLYNRYARPLDRIPPEDRYIMRKDRAGEVLDRRAMKLVSKSMGHNRVDVIAASYLYND